MAESDSAARISQVVDAIGIDRYRDLIADLRRQLAKLAAQITQGDAPPIIGAEAHRLRGAAGSLGVLPIAVALARLEEECSTGAVPAGWSDYIRELADAHADRAEPNR
jgi:HPt (histidine-containing phosphotransfer) domain-containing protein